MSRVFTIAGWGTPDLMSSDSLFDAEGGFLHDKEMVIGVHMSVMQMVRAPGLAAKLIEV